VAGSVEAGSLAQKDAPYAPIVSNAELQQSLRAALDSYKIRPDRASNYLLRKLTITDARDSTAELSSTQNGTVGSTNRDRLGSHDCADGSAAPRRNNKPVSIFAFPGSHNINDWVTNSAFTQLAANNFESLQPHFTGTDFYLHRGFAERLGVIVTQTDFMKELDEALAAGHRIIFTGHSLGGAVATVAALLLLSRQALAHLPTT
jgi:dipeptidyl aminopeptidase/acylaminoacyl peptidase